MAIAVSRTSALSSGAEHICIVLVLLLICVGLQHAAGAYALEFNTDEASHYVSGLMMHDYLRYPTGSPMTYTLDGKQYLVVAISGAGYPGELVAFRVPD